MIKKSKCTKNVIDFDKDGSAKLTLKYEMWGSSEIQNKHLIIVII